MEFNEPIASLELNKQQQLARNVHVWGITSDLRIRRPYIIFLKLCRKLGVYVTRASIENIIQSEDRLIVTFYQLKTKRIVLNQTSGLHAWINELIVLRNGQAPWKIYIQNHMSPFYYDIYKEAGKLRSLRLLYSYHLNENGFGVKVRENSAQHIVQTKQQLLNLVKDFP